MEPNDVGQLVDAWLEQFAAGQTGRFRQQPDMNLNEICQFVTHRIRRANQKKFLLFGLPSCTLWWLEKDLKNCRENMERNESCQFVLTGYFSTAVLWFFALIILIHWHPREYNQQTQKIQLSNCSVVTWQHSWVFSFFVSMLFVIFLSLVQYASSSHQRSTFQDEAKALGWAKPSGSGSGSNWTRARCPRCNRW